MARQPEHRPLPPATLPDTGLTTLEFTTVVAIALTIFCAFYFTAQFARGGTARAPTAACHQVPRG